MARESLQVIRLPDIPCVECVIIKVALYELSLVIGGFYRPPNTKDGFFDSLNEFLCTNKSSSNILLGGDFNVPLIEWDKEFPNPLCNTAETFVDLLIFHDLTQIVKEPTRTQNGTSSILDLFLVSNSILHRGPKINVLKGISDHSMVYLTMPLKSVTKTKPVECMVPVFTRADDVAILDALDVSFSDFVARSHSSESSADDLWCFFKNLVLRCVKDFVPLKRKIVRTTSPWMTKQVVRLGRKTKRIRKQHQKLPSAHNASRLTEVRLQLKQSIKKAKEYYHNVSMKNFLLSSPAKFWRHFKPPKKSVLNLRIGQVTTADHSIIAESFNQFFCSVFTDDNGRRPSLELYNDPPPIDDVEVSEEGVLSLLLNIDAKKSPGIDGIPNAFLVRYAEWCSKYLCVLFNQTILRADIPKDWKYGKIIPIPKSPNTSLLGSYRPISLLSSCAKTLEHIICKHMSTFLETNCLIDQRQHGFRKGLSTTTQLLETIHDFAQVLDKQGQIDIIYLDFEKAFDRVSHQKLLLKLQAVLKNSTLIAWIEAYLSDRQQSVFFQGASSSAASVQSGIPQGSVLGPLFFLVFINDILHDIPVNIKLFADDCIIYQEIKSSNDHALLQVALSKIESWCSTWQMKINEKKTVAMRITRKKQPLTFSYSTNGQHLSFVESYKYLGVIITSDLKWNDHVTYIQKKAMCKLGFLRRSLRQSTHEVKLIAYKTFVRPILEYASVVWDPYTQGNIKKLENVQRKSVRFIFNSYSRNSSPSMLLDRANLETLQERRRKERLKYMHLIYHGTLKLNRDQYIKHVSRRPTRSHHSKKLNDFACKTDSFKYSFFPRTVREWNSLCRDAMECPTLETFLKMI